MSIDPAITRNDDGTVTVDLSKAQSPEVKMALNTMGIEFNAEPVRQLLEGGIWYNVSHQPLKVI